MITKCLALKIAIFCDVFSYFKMESLGLNHKTMKCKVAFPTFLRDI